MLASFTHHFWFSSVIPISVVCGHFADVMKCIFITENICILILISLNFVPMGPYDNKLAMVQVMTWHGSRATSHYVNQWWLNSLTHTSSPGLLVLIILWMLSVSVWLDPSKLPPFMTMGLWACIMGQTISQSYGPHQRMTIKYWRIQRYLQSITWDNSSHFIENFTSNQYCGGTCQLFNIEQAKNTIKQTHMIF